MRASLQHRPLLCFACAFAFGVAARGSGQAPLWLIALAFAAGAFLLVRRAPSWPLATAGLILTGLACGALRETAARIAPANDIGRYASQGALATVTGVVDGDPEILPGRMVFRLRAEQIQARGGTALVTGQVYVTVVSSHARTLPLQAHTLPLQSRALSLPARAFPLQAHALPLLDYGDHVALRGYLDAPRPATNPGAFSWRDYLARQGVYSVLNVRQPPVRLPQDSGRNPFLAVAWAARRRIAAALKAHLPPIDAAVLCGVLIGQRADLPPSLMSDFVHSGTAHVLASAGLHVGVLAWWLLAGARRLTLPRRWSSLGIIAVLWLYAVMAGGRPSVTRAVLLATVYLAAFLFEREADLPTSLGFAALAILLDNPQTLFDSGFQMSFLTVATLAAAMPRWSDYWRGVTERRIASPPARQAAFRTLEMIGLSVFAQLGSAPIIAAAYNEFSLSGLLANLLVVPALFLIIPLGFLTAAMSGVSSAAGAFGAMLLLAPLDYIVAVVRACGEAPWAYRAIPTPSTAAIALYYAAVALAARLLSRRKISARPEASE